MSQLNDVTFIMNRAESMTIEFNTASSGGYAWEFEAPEGIWVRQIENKALTSAASENENATIGADIKTKFMIMAEYSGDYQLTFTHKRPWSGETIETQKFKITVR